MNLNTIREVKQPRCAYEIVKWSPGYAWLAGGTWLFSTPQIATDTLIDLRALCWPALAASNTGLDIAATCTIAELYGFQPPAEWTAAPLFQLCARAFLASFKIWNVVLLSLILPQVSRQLTWWLSPAEYDGKRDFAGVALVIGIYALWLIAFWQYQTRFGRPY